MNNGEEKFYMCFLPIYFFIIISASILFLIVLYIKKGADIDPIGVVIALTALIIVTVPMTRKLIKKMYISVTQHGMQGHDTFGKPRYVAWGEITKVRLLNLLFFKYLLIYTKSDSKITWLPLTVREPEKYYAKVVSFINQGNPLLPYFEK